eukprot:966434-Amphidinium_carterae.1
MVAAEVGVIKDVAQILFSTNNFARSHSMALQRKNFRKIRGCKTLYCKRTVTTQIPSCAIPLGDWAYQGGGSYMPHFSRLSPREAQSSWQCVSE